MTTRQLYYSVEQAMLYDFFEIDRPEHLQPIDIHEPDARAPRQAIHVVPDCSGELDSEWALPNAVARIALSHIQQRLPQWYAGDGETNLFGRSIHKTGGTDLLLLPLHLFTLNWADSGPGYSWPEAYHVTWFPIFERFVVTASADSPDSWGYEDRAIGYFGPEKKPVEGARKVVTDFWRFQFGGWDQNRWVYLFDEGAVSNAEAQAWADEVWEVEVEED